MTYRPLPFSALLDALPRCHSTTQFKNYFLPLICEFFSASTAVMHYYTGSSDYGTFHDPVYVNIDPSYIDKFRDSFANIDPFPPAALRGYQEGAGHAFSSAALINMEEFSGTDFYRSFLKPQGIYHMLIVVIARDDKPFAFLGIHRGIDQPAFSADEVELANQLGPYLSSVADRVHMADELALYKRTVETLSYGLMNKGVLILDPSMRLIYANEYAGLAMADCDDFDSDTRRFPDVIAQACQSLLALGENLNVTSSANFTLNIDAQTINGYVRANHHQQQPMLFLAFFNSDEYGVVNPKVCDEFGITARELAVVRCVAEGKTNPEIADELFISVRTVQNHLRSIFTKCDVHNRTSLTNKVLSVS